MGMIAQSVSSTDPSGPVEWTMAPSAQDIRHKLQLAEHLFQCGDAMRAADLYLEVGAAYAHKARVQEAIAICYRALHIDPSRLIEVAVGHTLRQIGRTAAPVAGQAAEHHLAHGNVVEALRMARLAVELEPGDALLRVRTAEILLAQHQYPQAVAALFDAGGRLLADGNNADFLAVAEQILSIDAYHAPTLREMARTHLRLGEPHLAVARLATLHKAAPQDPASYEILAHAFASIGRTPKALAILTRLVHDLRDEGHEDGAQQMLDRAKWWRQGDEPYQRTLLALRTPAPPPTAPVAPREATVMLSIDDIMIQDIAIEPERDLEGTLILAIDDIAFVEASRHRARRPAPPREHTRVLDVRDLMFEEPPRRPALAADDDTTAVRKSPIGPTVRRTSPPPLRKVTRKAPARRGPPPPPPPRKRS
jgi:tetratricopeptide (TPR) repeat protein